MEVFLHRRLFGAMGGCARREGCAAPFPCPAPQVHGDVFRPARHLEPLSCLPFFNVAYHFCAPAALQVHGDVFRPARHLELLSALIGTGVQLALLVLSVILITIAGTLFVERGTIVTVFIICYALTSFVGG